MITPTGGRRRPTDQEAISVELVSGLLMIIGIGLFIYLFYAIVTNQDLKDATQGLDVEGIGTDVRKITPDPTIEQQSHVVLHVEEGSRAANKLAEGDILLKIRIGDEVVDGLELESVNDLNQRLASTSETNVLVTVYRDGEELPAALPRSTLIEAETGLSFEYIPAEEVEPVFELLPIAGGFAESSGVATGDVLLAVDGQDITSDMTLQEVRALLAEEDMKLDDDDFEITLTYLHIDKEGSEKQIERAIPKAVAPIPVLAYLENFGFVVPFIAIFVGILLMRLGARLRQYDIVSARWSQAAYLWLIVALFVGAIWSFWVEGKGGLVGDAPFDYGRGLESALPYILATIPLFVARMWLVSVTEELFLGEEMLGSRNARFAWTLLIPTIAVLAFVAARPLEQTFIKSLTDDEFGTHRPARFVGLDNYVNLLKFKFATVDCKKDEGSDECAVTSNGETVWQRSDVEEDEMQKVRELSSEERKDYIRYQEANTWGFGDKGIRLLGKDPIFWTALGNTLQFTFLSVLLELILGMVVAIVVNSKFPGRGMMRTAMLVPWSIPTVVAAVLWQTMLRGDQTGILNKLLMDLGLLDKPEQWFSGTGPWMNSIVAVDVWKTTPFMALLILAGLQTIPGDVYEAADVDGASKVRQFFSITLPLLRPTLAVALVFRTLDALRAFDVFQVLLDTTRPSLAAYNYNQLVLSRQDGYASAIGVIIFILILLFTVGYVRIVGIEQE